jgi:hypothetical protein
MPDCRCYNPPFDFRDFNSEPIGIDTINGRFGEASVQICKYCGARWLHYLVEYEAVPLSGRWFRGLISDPDLAALTPQDVIPYLERQPWYFVGGSYFSSIGQRCSGKIDADW